jgi:hypothetical protein
MRAICLSLSLFLPGVANAMSLLRSEGIATTANGAVAYREVHWQRGTAEGAQRWVQYLCADGRPFARKQMPASPRPQTRGYRLQDLRSGQNADVQVHEDAVRINWKEDARAAQRTQRIPLPTGAVIDAGFDAAVRAHWHALLRGEPVELPFLVPGRQRFYPVRLRHVGPVRWQGMAAQAMEARLDTWYGTLAPRLSLVYADADRRLLEFRGASNLRDARGDYPAVVVRFDRPASAGSIAEWQKALAAPLVATCGGGE